MTSPLAELERLIPSTMPDVRVEHIPMKDPAQADALDVRHRDRLITILWTATDGICITEVSDDSAFDDIPDYAGVSVGEAVQLVEFLLATVQFKDVSSDGSGAATPARVAA